MKFFYTLLLFAVGSNSFAQDPILFQNIWYLHSQTTDEIEYIPPINIEVPFVSLQFEQAEIIMNMCDGGGLAGVLYNEMSGFTLSESMAFLAGGCYENNPENSNFLQIHQSYWDSSNTTYIFTYSISQFGNENILTIFNPDGDKTIYSNQLLSTKENKKTSFLIYPNPVKETVYIKNTTLVSKIKIYDTGGKLLYVNEHNNLNNPTINVQYLSKGIYFIIIEDEQNNITTQKFLKF